MTASIDQIKKLRNATGAGVNAIREALAETDGSDEAAMSYLRQKGMAKADKRKDNDTDNGVLGTYVHSNNQVVVIVEINTETDFAARGEDVQQFAEDMALQVAAAGAKYVDVEGVDNAELEKEKETYLQDLEGKPEEVKEKILEGKLEKFYQQVVLTKQTLFTDENKTVEDALNELVAKVGEKIVIKRFVKFEVAGEPTLAEAS